MNAEDVTRALIKMINIRTNIAVPNVSWGFAHWGECDLLCMSSSGYLTEYEIKVSRSDLKREWNKDRWVDPRFNNVFREMVKNYYIVMPQKMADTCLDLIPEDVGAGIIVADFTDDRFPTRPPRATNIKDPVPNKARKMTDEEKFQLARLGTMRYWSRFFNKAA